MKEAEEGHIASHSDREHKSAKVLFIHGNSREKKQVSVSCRLRSGLLAILAL